MSLNISSKILALPSQRVKSAQHDLSQQKVTLLCDRDRRYRPVDPITGRAASINRYVRRTVRDLPLCGYDCYIEIELAQVVTADGSRRMEASELVDNGVRFTQRCCHLISGMCRHMSIQAVALHLGLRWETVKNIDKAYLYSESLFRTLKYRPEWPSSGFTSLSDARDWVQNFSDWYNHKHRHSKLNFVTPAQRHAGLDEGILLKRKQVLARPKSSLGDHLTVKCPPHWCMINTT